MVSDNNIFGMTPSELESRLLREVPLILIPRVIWPVVAGVGVAMLIAALLV